MSNPEINKNLKIFLKITLKFYDSAISVLLIILLFIDMIMTNSSIDQVSNIFGYLIIIIILDIVFNQKIISNILRLNNFLSEKSKKILENFLKGTFYFIILYSIIISPIGVPPTFILPLIASIDFYFLISILLITGLYFSILRITRIFFEKRTPSDL